jgi:hypothetical protein
MKNLILIAAFLMSSNLICFAQDTGYIGVSVSLSGNKDFLKITGYYYGSPADIAGLKIGDRIYRIDDEDVAKISDPVSHIKGVPGTSVKLTIGRQFDGSTMDVNVPRISVPFGNDDYVSEKKLTYFIHTSNSYDKMLDIVTDKQSMALQSDPDRDILAYKTYDYDYSSVDDPLTEKALLKEVGKKLDSKGMHRDTENPDMLVLITFYSGQKEQYVPPQQMVSTKVKTVYNWYWGFIPMPITESTTTEGHTDVTYYNMIGLKFLDAHEIETSKVPPVIWAGSVSKVMTEKVLLTDQAEGFFDKMLFQFPEIWFPNSESYYLEEYAYTGLWYNMNDLRTIIEVNPGSPADKAGIKKGDKIININGYGLPKNFEDAKGKGEFDVWHNMATVGPQSGLRYLFMYMGLNFKPYKTEVTTLTFKVERNGDKMSIDVTPEKKLAYFLIK